ncbi:ATP-binding protein [Pyxidicoccus xibeiensis]|uniref:ATP-binding protein n=1 Tax=Pyxidicoccus xibeiensis TaxID=2906759 RepID=UPI0020A6EE13|nr:ATP-binding protein [Pyxidicoccus xibeiensis]MCP3140245.1 ATP-binding protein [Pyxidicoccus xibeiensis]
MGELMRSIDWSRTKLGPVAQWPRSLKTMVGVILGSPFPMLVWWGPEMLQLYNDAYRPVLGRKHPASMGAPGRLIWPEIWDVIGPMAEGVLAGGPPPWREDFQLFINSRGFVEETFHTFSYSPVPDDDGRVGGVLNTVQETTQKVQGERQLRMLRDLAARLSDAKSADEACELAAATFATNDADLPFSLVYLLDADGREVRLRGSSGLEGYDGPAKAGHVTLGAAPEGTGWPFAEAVAAGHVGVSDLASRFGALPGGRWGSPPERAILVPLARPGHPRPYGFLVSGLSPRRKFDEQYLGLFQLTADQVATAITNARTYEEERRRAEVLAELDRAKTAFFSNVSHEFRTPLTLMLGPTEDALAQPQRTLAGENLLVVYRNALRLLKLVNSLLDFSRIEAGRATASYEPTDLASVTTDLASAFQSAIERAGLRFIVDCAPLPEAVYVDQDMWEKIVLNLLSNALKFTFAGEIGICLRWVGEGMELVVRDTGIGIPAPELPNVFKRFHRVQGAKSRTHEGSGIGLALVHELVRLHGGTIDVASQEGEGTCFRVSLPRGFAHLPQERVRAKPPQLTTATGVAPYVQEALRWLPGDDSVQDAGALETGALSMLGPGTLATNPNARILLADDNADMRDYVRRLLGERWRVEAVSDGAAALEAARRAPPDLVLTDVMMPGLDGFGLLQALRADARLRAVPVIMLSARAGEESRIEGLEAGADDYLVKPFSARELLARVATHLQLSELRRAALREREKMYALFEQAPVPIAVLQGAEHVFALANPRYLEMVRREGVIGKSIMEVFPEVRGSPIQAMYDRVFRTGQPFVADEFRAELDLGRGVEESFFTFNAFPVRDTGGAVDGIMVVCVNITEQVRARQGREEAARERELLLFSEQEARREAESANRAKDEFLAMLGHELRNPLAPITTALHLMGLRLGDAAQKERKVIERQVDHLMRLVDDLLDVSRITRGKVELKRQPVELAEVVAKAIEMASPLLEQRQHHLFLSVPARGLAVDADPTRLAQVVSNLLTNAAKYTEPGGRIEVSAVREDAEVILKVRDTGIGIAPEVLPRVFDLFVQERQSLDRSLGGLGLGLTIVRSLVAMHGGRVTAHSEGKGRGTEFTIQMPALARQAEAAPASHVSGPSHVRAALASGRRILLVDDNEDAVDLLSEFLESLGHVTRIAYDGPSGLSLAEAFQPDLALLDIGLPVMDGYELARRLRAMPRLSQVQLIAVTGYGQEADRIRSREAGFDAHLVKPVQLAQLEALLKGLMDSGPASAPAA